MITAYQVFGVAENAPLEDITRSWKNLMKRYHPDVAPGAENERICKEINSPASPSIAWYAATVNTLM